MSNNLIRIIESMELQGFLNVNDRKKLESFASEFAVIDWCIDDVKETALAEYGKALSEEECKEVLSLCESDHDATMGINWDTIKYHIEELELDK